MLFTRLTVTLAAVTGLLFGGSAITSASTGVGGDLHRSTPGQFEYVDPVFGPVRCNEVHHPRNKLPGGLSAGATTIAGYDTVQCRFGDSPSPLAGQELSFGWFSDFGGQFDQNLGVIALRVDGGGRGYHGVAWYPAG